MVQCHFLAVFTAMLGESSETSFSESFSANQVHLTQQTGSLVPLAQAFRVGEWSMLNYLIHICAFLKLLSEREQTFSHKQTYFAPYMCHSHCVLRDVNRRMVQLLTTKCTYDLAKWKQITDSFTPMLMILHSIIIFSATNFYDCFRDGKSGDLKYKSWLKQQYITHTFQVVYDIYQLDSLFHPCFESVLHGFFSGWGWHDGGGAQHKVIDHQIEEVVGQHQFSTAVPYIPGWYWLPQSCQVDILCSKLKWHFDIYNLVSDLQIAEHLEFGRSCRIPWLVDEVNGAWCICVVYSSCTSLMHNTFSFTHTHDSKCPILSDQNTTDACPADAQMRSTALVCNDSLLPKWAITIAGSDCWHLK